MGQHMAYHLGGGVVYIGVRQAPVTSSAQPKNWKVESSSRRERLSQGNLLKRLRQEIVCKSSTSKTQRKISTSYLAT